MVLRCFGWAELNYQSTSWVLKPAFFCQKYKINDEMNEEMLVQYFWKIILLKSWFLILKQIENKSWYVRGFIPTAYSYNMYFKFNLSKERIVIARYKQSFFCYQIYSLVIPRIISKIICKWIGLLFGFQPSSPQWKNWKTGYSRGGG